ncbi:MAG: alpha/beta fold hydrolase [Acidobacteriota bacterium]
MGKALMYASGAFLGAYILSNVIWAWILVRSNPRKELDCVDNVSFGKLEPVELTTSDGVQLHAWVQWSHRTTRFRYVLLLHGYRSDRNVLHLRRRFYVRRGYHVMLLHFRGHGSSESAHISYGFNERKDIRAAIDFIRMMHKHQNVEIGIDGVSMGAAAAAFAIAYEGVDPDWIVLESCYDDIKRALANRLETHFPVPFVPFIARPLEFVGQHVFRLPINDLNPALALKQIHCPVLVLAGDSEKVLKVEEVEQLFLNIPDPKRLVFFPGAGHEDLLANNPRKFIKEVNAFLKEFSSPQNADPNHPAAHEKITKQSF